MLVRFKKSLDPFEIKLFKSTNERNIYLMILVMMIPQFSIFDGIISNCHVWRINRLGKVNYVSWMKEDLTILIATTLLRF